MNNPLLSFNTFMNNEFLFDNTPLNDPIIIDGQPITVGELLFDITNENKLYKIHDKILKDYRSGKFNNPTNQAVIDINTYYYNEIKKAQSGGKKHRKTKTKTKRRATRRRTNKRRR